MASDLRGRQFLQPLILELMPQQPGLVGTGDDWTGVTSSADRRRLQNRLNQRAHSKRKRKERNHQREGASSLSPLPQLDRRPDSTKARKTTNLDCSPMLRPQGTPIWELFYSGIWTGSVERQNLYQVAAICKRDSIEPKQIISEFERWVQECQMMGSPRTDHLLVLVKFNVFRGLMSNARDLGISDEESTGDDSLSPYSKPDCPSAFIRHAPAALEPTELQRQICHHPWIDTVPFPTMRDNLLLARDTYDELKLCSVLVGIHGESKDSDGMIVWGDPWNSTSWEVTESFVKDWGWAIRGCDTLLQSTNYWRRKRGERGLSFDRLLSKEVEESE